MWLPTNENEQSTHVRGVRDVQMVRAPWKRAVTLVLCLAALGATACGPSEDGSPAGDDDTDTDTNESTTPDDDSDDDTNEPPKGEGDGGAKGERDAGAKLDARTPTPTRDGSTLIDARAPGRSDASNVDPGPDDGGAGSDDDAQTPSGPVTLPTSDKMGPYEVVIAENVGKGFENPPTSANDRGDGAGCTGFIMSFGEEPDAAREYALFGPNYKVDLYTLYYPKNMVEGQRYPILSWANGTCAKTNGYNALLTHLASHGFIVVATNSRYTGSGRFQLRAIDYVYAEDANPMSPLFGKVDKEQVGVFGHSQGGGSTWAAAQDPRIKTSIVFNAPAPGTRPTPSFHVTGEKDIVTIANTMAVARRQMKGAAIGLKKIMDTGGGFPGHITLMKEPERTNPSATAWFRYQLLGDAEGKSWFVGADCKLCNQPEEWEFVAKGLQ